MKLQSLDQSISEAKRFIKSAEAAKARMRLDRYPDTVVSKETAACRRASMDLTRALSELRR